MSEIPTRNQNLIKIADLRDKLLSLMNPEVLSKLADLLSSMGGDRNTFVVQFRTWAERNGPDCRYAAMAKRFFLEEQAENIAKEICNIYHSWARFYEK
jgi:hypothetical protein